MYYTKEGVKMLPKLSCAISGFSRAGSVFDAVKTVAEAGFDGVDFSLSTYSRRGGVALCQDEWWRSWIEAVSTYLKELKLPVVQAHAAWDQTVPRDLSYQPPEPICFRNLEACAMLGCTRLVFHPLLYPYRVETKELAAKLHAYSVRWFRELLPTAARLGVTVEIENMFDYYHVWQPGDPPYVFTTAEQLLALADELSGDGVVGLCLDTGHANISGQDPAQMIRAYGKRLDCLHLNDNFGRSRGLREDLHLFPGEGNLDWRAILRALRETGFFGAYNLELIADLASLNADDRTSRLRHGREAFAAMLR